jgi:hypothetical protein
MNPRRRMSQPQTSPTPRVRRALEVDLKSETPRGTPPDDARSRPVTIARECVVRTGRMSSNLGRQPDPTRRSHSRAKLEVPRPNQGLTTVVMRRSSPRSAPFSKVILNAPRGARTSFRTALHAASGSGTSSRNIRVECSLGASRRVAESFGKHVSWSIETSARARRRSETLPVISRKCRLVFRSSGYGHEELRADPSAKIAG